MKRFCLGVGLLTLLTGACRTAPSWAPLEPQGSPAPPVTSAPSESPVPALREHLEALMEAASEAARRQDVDELTACDTAVSLAIAALSPGLERDQELTLLTAELFEELDRLRLDLVRGDMEDEDTPPEPAPVSRDTVVSAQEMAAAERFDLPVVVTPEVASLLQFYTGPYRDRFIVALGRAAEYLPAIREELNRQGLPLDLAYLPMVESAFNPRARSRARAQGLWQFMAGTARMYNLRVDSLVDERNDPFLSTTAAVTHLADLFAAFGDWELALAAYNSGSGRVRRAIARAGGETDFWELRRLLPRETRNYVPALWAVLVAVRNAETFGLPEIPDAPRCLARIPVRGTLDLAVLAERSGVDQRDLAAWNPALTYGLTPDYGLAVACDHHEVVASALAAIPQSERVRRFIHRVAQGDTLSAIARRYGSSTQAIVAARLRNPNRLSIGQTLVVPRDPTGGRTQVAVGGRAASPRSGASSAQRYVVQRGDTLYGIARRHSTTVSHIMRRNGLSDTRIRPAPGR